MLYANRIACIRTPNVDEDGAIVLGPMTEPRNHDGQDLACNKAIPFHRPNQGRINTMNEIKITKEIMQAQYTIIRELTDYELVGKLDDDLSLAYLIVLRLLHKKINGGDLT